MPGSLTRKPPHIYFLCVIPQPQCTSIQLLEVVDQDIRNLLSAYKSHEDKLRLYYSMKLKVCVIMNLGLWRFSLVSTVVSGIL